MQPIHRFILLYASAAAAIAIHLRRGGHSPCGMEANFDNLDRNGDGVISREEASAAAPCPKQTTCNYPANAYDFMQTMNPECAQKKCTPSCHWKCMEKKCDQACKPKCKAPRCQTRCMGKASIDTKKCKMTCNQPSCAVVCPNTCDGGTGCPQACKTECGTPVCKLACNDTLACKEVCEHPVCTWECTKPKCPQPNCTMTCEMLDSFACLKSTYQDLPPVKQNEMVIESFSAKLSVKNASLLRVNVSVGKAALLSGKVRVEHNTVDLPVA